MNKYISAIPQSRTRRGVSWPRVGLLLTMIMIGAALSLTPVVAHAEEQVHIVQRGESLGMIAERHGVSVRDLIRYNELSNPNIVVAGQRIRIPDEEALLAATAAAIEAAEEAAAIEAAAREAEAAAIEAEAKAVADAAAEAAAIAALEITDEAVAEGADEAAVAVSAEIEETLTTVAALPGVDGYHFVRYNDSLSGIAQSYGMTLADLMRLNSISDPNLLHVGDRLRVSVRAPDLDGDSTREATEAAAIHIVKADDTLKSLASEYGTTVRDLMAANGLPNEHFLHAGQRLRVQSKLPRSIINMDAAPADGERWIEVNIADQTLTAWQGDVPVLQTVVSTGKSSTPTVKGRFSVGAKYEKQRMFGDDYNIPNVPSVMYFYGAYAIHGAYWEPPFGTPSSHGCVNVRPTEAAVLFDWAPAGTEVWVHE